ncbi:MAG: hypothetical protein Q9191_002928 [Dirinaria sp. TL-2023a]
MKRSQLATPRGIDHDYNYLTSIERQLDNAQRDADHRGVIIHDAVTADGNWKAKGLDGPKKGEEPMRKAAERCGVIIARAPDGMSRRRNNATHWYKKKKQLLWTIEWIHNDGRSELGTCFESTPIADAYAAQFLPQSPEQDFNAPPKKRQKRFDGRRAAVSPIPTQERPDFLGSDNTCPPKPVAADAGNGVPSQSGLPIQEPVPQAPTDAHSEDKLKSITADLDSPQQEALPAAVAPSPSISVRPQPPYSANVLDEPPPINDTTTAASSLHYYLHAPRLPSMHPVLIPLPPNATLSESLQGRLVLEYPTIYVLAEQPEKLPDKYITEEIFFKKLQENGYRERLEARLTGQEEGELGNEVPLGKNSLDEGKLEEVLDRDLISLKE